MAGGRPGAGVSRLVSRGWPIRRNVAAWPVSDWFLPEGERVALDGGKPRAPARARRRLLRTHLEVVEAARAGDRIFFTGWRGDSDEWLTDAGPTSGSTWLVDPQIVTDVTSREQLVLDQTMGASLGDALLAAMELARSRPRRTGPKSAARA